MTEQVASGADVSQSNGSGSTVVVEAAQQYINKGYAVVPIPGRSKAPTDKNWTKKKYGAIDFTPGDNIGIKPVDGLVDVDLDVPEAVQLARTILPDTDMVSGHDGNPYSHYWYCSDGTQTKRYEDIDGTMLIERRASGVQTVAWPSIHPDGYQYQWYKDGVESSVDADVLTEKTEQLAATTLIARHWPQEQGSRHEFALGIAGFLTKGELDPDTVIAITENAATVGGDDEIDDRVLAAQTTVEHDPDSIKGQSVLVEILGQKEAYATTDKLTQWLHLKRQPREKQEASQPEPVDDFTTFDQVKRKELKWLWDGYIPLGKITMVDAMPDQGKSLLAIWLAGSVTTTGKMPDGSQGPTGGAVLISLEDDAEDTVLPRLEAVKANTKRVIDLSTVKKRDPETGEISGYPFVLPDDLPTLEKAINKVGAKIVGIDPFFAVLNHRLKGKDDQDTRIALTPLKELAAKTGCAVVIVRHFSKEERQDLLMRGAGNLGIVGAARSSLAILPDPNDPDRHILVVPKHNLTKRDRAPNIAYHIDEVGKDMPRIFWDGVESRTVKQLLENNNMGRLQLDILTYLTSNGETTLEVLYQAFADEEKDTVRKAANRKADSGDILKPSRGVYRPLPTQLSHTSQMSQTSQTNSPTTTIDIERDRETVNGTLGTNSVHVPNKGCCDPPDDPDCDCD
jgi:AAA domain/Bifunctional DNA primase/polymerase, N-terminal